MWKTNQLLIILPVSSRMYYISTESILYNIWECYSMNIDISTITSIRFAHPFSNTLFICIYQNSFIVTLVILKYSTV